MRRPRTWGLPALVAFVLAAAAAAAAGCGSSAAPAVPDAARASTATVPTTPPAPSQPAPPATTPAPAPPVTAPPTNPAPPVPPARWVRRGPLQVGLVANTLDAGRWRARDDRAAQALGVGWLREELRWGQVEPRRGVRDWRRTDALFVSAARAGLRVLPLIIGAPAWARPDADGLPAATHAFGAHVAAVVLRYGPGGAFWRARPRLDARLAPRWFELFNEPYLPRPGIAADPVRYAALVRAAATAGKAANRQTRFLAAVDTTYRDAAGTQRDWLDALLAADPALLELVDGAAVHPYGTIGTADAAAIPRQRFERIATIRRLLARHGAGDLPLWVTELGWSTCTGEPRCVSESQQARNLSAAFARLAAPSSGVAAAFVYHLRDWRVQPAGGREGAFGLLRRDRSPKPVWSVVRRATRAALQP